MFEPTDPNSTVTNWDGHLEINAERYSYYILPFTVSWPQRITIDAERPITSAARLIVLYAVITQKQLEINFTPSTGEKFGILHLTIQTQTQFPFGLRNDTDPVKRFDNYQLSRNNPLSRIGGLLSKIYFLYKMCINKFPGFARPFI